jgi:hypothetical protein
MTYPPPPGPDGSYPPPPDPPIQAYQPPVPPNPQQYGYGYQQPQIQGYGVQPAPGYDYVNAGSPYSQPVYPYAPPRPTEGLAIASLVVSCAGVLGLCAWTVGGVLGIVGAILGHVARRRISRNGSQGAGMALAGIIVGWVMFGITVIVITGLIIAIANDSGS